MYSLFDEFSPSPCFYKTRPRIYVISDSVFKAAQDRQNTERVSHLENVRADLLDSVNKVEAQIEALQTALPQAKQAIKAPIAEPAAAKETCSLSARKEFLW